jgi:hypothetical protein
MPTRKLSIKIKGNVLFRADCRRQSALRATTAAFLAHQGILRLASCFCCKNTKIACCRGFFCVRGSCRKKSLTDVNVMTLPIFVPVAALQLFQSAILEKSV